MRRELTLEELVAGVRGGDRRALARAISLVEDGDALAYPLVREVYPETGRARVVGVTGPPGVGKSSLIGALVAHIREREQTVGVVSVDPSSPFSRGALLGDRIRLSDHFLDPGRLHPLDGDARAPGRARRGEPAGRPAPRRRGQGRRVRRDGRSRAERGRGHRDRGHRPPRPHARIGRLRAGAEGRDHGDPRRDRDQQDGSPGGEDDAQRGALDRRPGGAGRSGPRSCSPARSTGRTSRRSGMRSRSTVPRSRATVGSRSVAARTSRPRCSPWRRVVRARICEPRWPAIRGCSASWPGSKNVSSIR